MNEEEIRGKLLLPFISDLGFDVSEISLEKSFLIRIGKTKYKTGRADILCKRNSQNLFVIEVKSESTSISQGDIDQGISYARALIDNIAPFTIITNGKSTRIFDSISRLEVTGKKISELSEFWKNDCTLSTDEDLRIRYEALKKFISFSEENLRIFCKNQVQDRIGPIIGNIDSPTSKFVKELYYERNDLQSAFETFVESEAKIFGLVGAAGVGKTNAMCSLALQSLEKSFTFFYNAALISKSPLEHIAQDLNVHFSSKNDVSLVLKRLSELGNYINSNIILFIDAIDESINTNLSSELSEIALAVRNLEKIKICISCKSSVWSKYLQINGTYTHLFEELNKSHDLIESLNKNPGYLLSDFNDVEFSSVISLYRSAFNFKGDISNFLLKELKNGFFLRIFSEVYQNKQIPEKVTEKNLIKSYLNQSLKKSTLDVQSSLRILSQIGKVLLSHTYSDIDEYLDSGVNYETLLDDLNFPLGESLPEDLFARNILIRSSKEDSQTISFYYSKIRDYIICFHSYKLDQLENESFYKILEEFYQNYIGQSAIKFYIENLNKESQKRTIKKFKEDKALKYVSIYDSYLEENFKNSKKLFTPKTDGEIGIVLPAGINGDGYALYPMKVGNLNKIIYEDLENPFSEFNYNNRFSEIGVETVYLNHSPLFEPNQDRHAQKDIFKQLESIIKRGQLKLYNSDTLLLEQVATIVYFYSAKLGYNFSIEDLDIPRFQAIYPLELEDIKEKVYKFRAYHYYRRKMNLESGLDHIVEEALKNGVPIPEIKISGDFPPFEELSKITDILIAKGYNKIEKHHLPYPDISITEARRLLSNAERNADHVWHTEYSGEQARLYIERFLTLLELAYKDFVEYFFPTFKNQFHFFAGIPHEYCIYSREESTGNWDRLGYRPSRDGKIAFHYKKFISMEVAHDEDKISNTLWLSFDKFFRVGYLDLVKTIDGLNTPRLDEYCVIRSWVYKMLKNDIRQLMKLNDARV